MTRSLHAAVLVTLAVISAAPVPDSSVEGEISDERYLAHVKFLASDELGGRGNGTPGLERAAEYIAAELRQAGLEPGGPNGSWFQPFEIVTSLEVGPGNRLELRNGARSTPFALGADYYPLSISAAPAGDTAKPDRLVFAGYGITAPELQYDDYAEIDVRGAAVVAFMHEPQEHDPQSRFDGTRLTRHAGVMQKAMVARARGARLLVVAIDPSHASDDGAFEGWLRDPQAETYGIAVVRVERGALQEALGTAIDFGDAARQIDGDLRPRSRVLEGVQVQLAEHLSPVRRQVRNVIGVVPGSDPDRAEEAIVVGAHYDHLGRGGRHSLAPESHGEIHNGADDNASGTAALLEMARAVSRRRDRFPRSTVFVAFAGEELGLLGSAHYVNHPAVPLDRTVAMVNLDMVGRPEGRVLLSGTDSAHGLGDDVDDVSRGRRIEVNRFREGAGVGASDDTSFLRRRVPSLSFFSGFHADYHRPSDDWDRLDLAGAVEVTRVAVALTARLSSRRERPVFTGKPAADPHASGAGDSGGGYGAYFGSVPDFGDSTQGVRFADIREGSPAALAGLRPSDVLVELDGARIATLHDFTHALRSRSPGDRVIVVVLREGRRVAAEVTLATRP